MKRTARLLAAAVLAATLDGCRSDDRRASGTAYPTGTPSPSSGSGFARTGASGSGGAVYSGSAAAGAVDPRRGSSSDSENGDDGEGGEGHGGIGDSGAGHGGG